MFKKLLILSAITLVFVTAIGCGLTTGPASTETTSSSTSESTTEASTDAGTTTLSTTLETTAHVTTTNTSLIDTIPEECSSIAVVDGWVPVWCDEFNYEGPVDATKWRHQNGGGGYGNQELQYYTDRPENAYVDGENLIITALREDYLGYQYTSSKIWTQGVASWKYGKFEMRAKLPDGRGTWMAFWMMPNSSKYGGWPDSGEIDIVEHVGYDMNNVIGTVHTERFFGANGRGGNCDSLIHAGTIPPIDVANTYHTYGVIWTEEKIDWYFDGFLYATVEHDEKWGSGYSADTSVDWPFDQQFYLILNLAIGGTWGGAQGIDSTIFPTTYTVDYVRVYQQDYVTGDTENPVAPKSPRILWQADRAAFITWIAATDDLRVRYYYIYINGVMAKKTAVNGVLLTTLRLGFDNIVTIIAEDYAGNLSNTLEMIVTA